MKSFRHLVAEALHRVKEIMPWDLEELLQTTPHVMLLDVREPYEFDAMHVAGSLNVPRGILESACEFDYEETVPALAEARHQDIVVICRSGFRSVLAADIMQNMGFENVTSLKTGLRGWNDYEQELVDRHGNPVDEDAAIDYFTPKLRPEQLKKT